MDYFPPGNGPRVRPSTNVHLSKCIHIDDGEAYSPGFAMTIEQARQAASNLLAAANLMEQRHKDYDSAYEKLTPAERQSFGLQKRGHE